MKIEKLPLGLEGKISLNLKFKGISKRFTIKKRQRLLKSVLAFGEKYREQLKNVRLYHNAIPLSAEETAETANLSENDCIVVEVLEGKNAILFYFSFHLRYLAKELCTNYEIKRLAQ